MHWYSAGALVLGFELIAYTDTLEEAQTLLSAFDSITTKLQNLLLQDDKVRSDTWGELFGLQDALVAWGTENDGFATAC